MELGYAPLFWIGREQGFEGMISSTGIRKSFLCSGEKPSGLPAEVYQYILDHNLYRE
jgi:nicotinate-nucleotide adenylyltransferase